jgi:hypothetical protein
MNTLSETAAGNLQRLTAEFARRTVRSDQPPPAPSPCCPPAEQTSCCTTEAKAECCAPTREKACGCQ